MAEWIVRGLPVYNGLIDGAQERWDAFKAGEAGTMCGVDCRPSERAEAAWLLKQGVLRADAEASFVANDGRIAVPAGAARELDPRPFVALLAALATPSS